MGVPYYFYVITQQHSGILDKIGPKNVHGFYLDSQESLFRWSVLLHNEVNRSLNKPIWNETDAKMHWEKKINGTGNSTNVHSSRRYWMILLSIMIVFIVIAGIIFAVRKLSKK